ncbi:right-handed parallel beta-helix repeat-containing protein [Streptomyces sp. NPDC127084]|uniref:right-handed parallel beta-helix repeat-containing protein n=1 Tax=Streptomyces sp. NPDC127084 TaxID=3347133 RepID=UPI00364E94DA
MSESGSQVAAVLSRHWKSAVLTAAGFATVVATTTIVTATDSEEPAPQAATALADGKGAEGGAARGKGDEGKGGSDGADGGKGGDDKSGHDKYAHHDDPEATHVECDPNSLISALVDLNSDTGGVLVLAKDCTYTLTANEGGNGLPEITQPITIHGNGAVIQRAANADNFRFFEIAAGGDLKLRHLTLTRGKAAPDESGGALYVHASGRLDLDCVTVTRNTVDNATANDEDGAGIYTEGVVTIHNSTLSKNVSDDGPAVFNVGGKLEIYKSRITGNVSDIEDGFAAIYNQDGSVKISRSLIDHNHAYEGGGVYSSGTTEVEDSGVLYNRSSWGGGIYQEFGTLSVRGSTVAYNTASENNGGGLHLADSATIEGSRIHANVATASNGGGVFTNLADDETVSIRDTAITGNQAPGNESSGGGIYVGEDDRIRLTDVKVTGNISDLEAGGVHNLGTVTTAGKVRIIDNVPTNCEALGTNPVPNCFG